MDSKFGKRLSAEEVAVIAQAFAGLARMDPDFAAKAELVPDGKSVNALAGALGELTSA